jgi:hypothetical protein
VSKRIELREPFGSIEQRVRVSLRAQRTRAHGGDSVGGGERRKRRGVSGRASCTGGIGRRNDGRGADERTRPAQKAAANVVDGVT